MAKCASKEELSNHLKKLVAKNSVEPVVIQQFIDIEEEYNIHGICDGNMLFLPIIHRKEATGSFSKGVTILGKNLDPQTLEPDISRLKSMLLSMGYHGIFNVEMFCSNGKVYLNEINVRIAGTCWGATGAGVNIPELWVKCLCGDNADWDTVKVRFDTVFINDKTAYEDLMNKYISRKQFFKYNKQADYHLIKNEDDKEPWKVFVKGMKHKKRQDTLKTIKRFIKRLIKRR